MYVSSFEIHARLLYDINIGLLQAPTSPLGSRRFVCQNPFHLASRYNRAATSPLGSPAASSLPVSISFPPSLSPPFLHVRVRANSVLASVQLQHLSLFLLLLTLYLTWPVGRSLHSVNMQATTSHPFRLPQSPYYRLLAPLKRLARHTRFSLL